jgi:hypothetical protein
MAFPPPDLLRHHIGNHPHNQNQREEEDSSHGQDKDHSIH